MVDIAIATGGVQSSREWHGMGTIAQLLGTLIRACYSDWYKNGTYFQHGHQILYQ